MYVRLMYLVTKNPRIQQMILCNWLNYLRLRSSHRTWSVRKGVLKRFARFIGKLLCQRLFFNKVVGAACNFIKKESLAQVFSYEFCEIFKSTFLTEHFWTTTSQD